MKIGEKERRTNRTSPESLNGFVVNHSHMNALVDPSLTESMRPRMSLFTMLLVNIRGIEIITV